MSKGRLSESGNCADAPGPEPRGILEIVAQDTAELHWSLRGHAKFHAAIKPSLLMSGFHLTLLLIFLLLMSVAAVFLCTAKALNGLAKVMAEWRKGKPRVRMTMHLEPSSVPPPQATVRLPKQNGGP